MKITSVRVFEMTGKPRSGLALFEIPRGGLEPGEVSPYSLMRTEIATDTGLVGVAPGGSQSTKALGQTLIGRDPLAIEAIWEDLYTSSYTRFQQMREIAALDIALWDLVGKAYEVPLYRLWGGPTRESIPAYAAMLGYSVQPEDAARSSREQVDQGFAGVKWYLPCNAQDGLDGFRRNVALIAAVREAIGDDIDLMVDWLLADPTKNSLLYAQKLARALEPYHPTWIEEPLYFDQLDAYAKLAQTTTIPLAFGEHWYNRWQIRQCLESGAPSVLQPEASTSGGLSEIRRIITMASAYGIPVVPHANESCRLTIHTLFSSPAHTCPMAEWGIRLNHNAQHFYTDFYAPVDGAFQPPNGPGLGIVFDKTKTVQEREL